MSLRANQVVPLKNTGRRPIDVEVRCTCSVSPLLGAMFHLQGRWWWWQVLERASVLATLKREGWPAAVRDSNVTDADAEALGFVPPDMRRTVTETVTAEGALQRKIGPFHWQPTTRGWLRRCPACGRVPEIRRKDLYAKAEDAVGRDEHMIYV